MAWKPLKDAPKDGTFVLVCGYNSIGKAMVPMVAAYRNAEIGSKNNGLAWRSSETLNDLSDALISTSNKAPEWHPLPAE
ncbi:MAG: hypothetical protein AAF720_00985 [Pseudomonadota bacterium]